MKIILSKVIGIARKYKIVVTVLGIVIVIAVSFLLGTKFGAHKIVDDVTDAANPYIEDTTEPVTDPTTELSEPETESVEVTATEQDASTEGVLGTSDNPILNDIDIKNIETFILGNHEIVLPCTLKELIGEEKAKMYEDKLKELISGKKDSQYYELTVMVDEALHKAVCNLKIAEPKEEDGKKQSNDDINRVYINAIQSTEPVIKICDIAVGNTLDELKAAMQDNVKYSAVGKVEAPIVIYRTVHYRISFYINEKDVITQIHVEYIGDDNSTIVVP